MSIRVCLVNTQAYRHSCRMATGCYLPRTTVCLGPNMTRPPAEICRLIETSLRHLHISAYGHAIESSVKSFYSHRTMKCFSHCFMRFSPACLCGYSFAKVLSALPNAKPETGKSSSNGVERICCSFICLIACQHAGNAKNIPLGKPESLKQKGKRFRAYDTD